jgi:hypothetical protein
MFRRVAATATPFVWSDRVGMILSAPPPVMPAPIPATVAPPPISAPFEAAGEHHLRETLGLPSIDGVRPMSKKPA